MNTTKIRMLEFFSGIGGMRLSLEKALLFRGGVMLAWVARCLSFFKVEHWLLLLLLRLAWFVGWTRLRRLDTGIWWYYEVVGRGGFSKDAANHKSSIFYFNQVYQRNPPWVLKCIHKWDFGFWKQSNFKAFFRPSTLKTQLHCHPGTVQARKVCS